MGKHSKKVDCSVCHGTGLTQQSLDGKVVKVACTACGGSGKQP